MAPKPRKKAQAKRRRKAKPRGGGVVGDVVKKVGGVIKRNPKKTAAAVAAGTALLVEAAHQLDGGTFGLATGRPTHGVPLNAGWLTVDHLDGVSTHTPDGEAISQDWVHVPRPPYPNEIRRAGNISRITPKPRYRSPAGRRIAAEKRAIVRARMQ